MFSYRHFERREKSFLQSDKRRMCEIRDEWLGIRSLEGLVTGDLNGIFGHRHYFYSAALLIFMRRTPLFEPPEPAFLYSSIPSSILL